MMQARKVAFIGLVWFLVLCSGINHATADCYYPTVSALNRSRSSETGIFNVSIQISPQEGYSLQNNTPIILKLGNISNFLPTTVDPFGNDSLFNISDDINWLGTYVSHDGKIIPSQVDNLDNTTDFSDTDELVFQLPKNLSDGDVITLNMYVATKGVNFPEPVFPEICNVYQYPKISQIAEYFGTDMMAEAYYIENKGIQACALVAAAWSSGSIYELSVLDEEGNSQWDAIKQRFQEDWESWKWARFASIEQFVETNDKATINPFKLNRIIEGPVRAQIQMQSTAPYGKSTSSWGTKPGVYGLVTYSLYSKLPYLDYALDITGPNAATNLSLQIDYQNREKNPGGWYSPYKWIYLPGKGYIQRLETHSINRTDYSSPWLIEKLKPGETMHPNETNADKLGYGFIFEDTGLTNISYRYNSELVKFFYSTAEFPLLTRYFPFDESVTNDSINYMNKQYLDWIKPAPVLTISVTQTQELPFNVSTTTTIHTTLPVTTNTTTTTTTTTASTQTVNSTFQPTTSETTPTITSGFNLVTSLSIIIIVLKRRHSK